MMTRVLVPALAGIAALAVGAWQVGMRPAATAAMVVPQPLPRFSTSEAEQRERDIAFYAGRARRDPLGAFDRSKLAELYLQRARETGSFEDLRRAERAARASVALREGHNARSRQLLASTLLAQHRFAEALAVARELVAAEPDVATFRALLGECQLEVGDYAGADTTFGALQRSSSELSVIPRLARWHELEGRTDIARRLLRVARDNARRDSTGMLREQRAWFELRVGDFELRHGRLAAADSAFHAGLVIFPGDYRLLGGMARLALARDHPARAAAYGEQAVASVLDPATLGTVADAYLRLGDTTRAEEYAHALDIAVLRQPGAYHRAWSLWLLDHRRHVPAVAAKVRQELRTRRDVYGLDLQAWALHTQGRDASARAVMARALALGTEDALIFYQAGVIERALGHSARARTFFSRALAANPYFHPAQAADARGYLAAKE
jgi:tetratricopeptide (TPR) repeat protein